MTLEEIRAAQLAQQENTVIAGTGLRAKLERLLAAKDIDKARRMFACHHDEAMQAIKYHNPEQHEIMTRADKFLQDNQVYETAKITRNICEVANNTGTFFMFGNPLTITLGNEPDDAKRLKDAFKTFNEFLGEVYFHERMYEAREAAGSETECAKIYDLYVDEDGKSHITCRVHKNSMNEKLYPMFNQHGQLVAFAMGYFLRSNDDELNNIEEHFDVWTTKNIMYFCRKDETSKWEMIHNRLNPFDKIPVLYYRHEVDWKGAERTIDRMEWVLSKHADTVDYFGDPYLVVSQDIVNNRLSGAKEVGKVIVSDDVEKSQFEFVAPPDGGDLVKNHMTELKEDFLIDTMNPDLSYKSIMGLGTLSGEAMRRIYVPGYIKRVKFAVKIYNEMIRRELNLIKAILINYRYSGNSKMSSDIQELILHFAYTDPFIGGIEDNTEQIESLTAQKVMSKYAAVQANRFVTDKEAEYERLWEEEERMLRLQAKVQAEIAAQQVKTNKTEE